jgi:hypothetical protein
MSGAAVEARLDFLIANLSMLYLLVMLIFFGWLLFDVWIGQHTIARLLGYSLVRLDTPDFRFIAYAMIGGAVGGTMNGLRSAVQYFQVFKRSYIWKYITAPWMGMVLGLLVYALIHGSIAIFGGQAIGEVSTTQALTNFAVGALAGYGARDVFIWLDAQVTNFFKEKEETPDVRGVPQEVAEDHLVQTGFDVGAVAAVPARDETEEGIVQDQLPQPGEEVNRGDAVNLVVSHKDD